MLEQYKNINEIKSASTSLSADRLDSQQSELLSYDIVVDSTVMQTEDDINVNDQKYEVHFYSGNSWVTGNHQVTPLQTIPEYINASLNKPITFRGEPLAFNLQQELTNLKLTSGKFRFVVNFFQNLIGDYNQQYLRIDDISPDRTELRLVAIDNDDPNYLSQITKYIQTVNQTRTTYFKTYLLNFSRNKTVMFINSVVVGDYLYIKLAEPLPATYKLNFKCWVVRELKNPYIDTVNVIPKTDTTTYNQLANPNWQANSIYNTSTETNLKTWNELLGSSVQTSQQLVDSYFSGSLSGVELNIDYTDFNNFVFYSSATERLENFKYKIELIEFYNSQSIAISGISGSVATTNASDYSSLKTNLISGFDSFEKFLYYESSSRLTTNEIPHPNPNVASITGSYLSPIPKTNSTKPYTNVSVNSSQFKTWYDGLYTYATQYDTENVNSIVRAIPEHILLNDDNINTITFVNMLGHHYDILYTYVNHMTQINKRVENPNRCY